MRTRLVVPAALAAAMTVAGCTSTASGRAGPPPAPAPADPGAAYRLVSYDSCAQAIAELRRAALRVVGPYGFAGDGGVVAADAGSQRGPAPPAAPGATESRTTTGAAADHSTTNVHEPGVDEPDLVKTDGRRIVTVVGGRLRVVDAASRRVTGTLPLSDGGSPSPAYLPTNLLLSGDRALVLVASQEYVVSGRFDDAPTRARPPGLPEPPTGITGPRLLLVDLSGPPRLVGEVTLDGQYVDARQVGRTVRVVVRSRPRLPFVYPDGVRSTAAAAAANRQVVARSTAADWLPRYELLRPGRAPEPGQVPCERVAHPAAYTASSLLTVFSYDLAGDPATDVLSSGDPVSVLADGDTVYGTAGSLYVATDLSWRGSGQVTQVHRFDLSGPGRPRYAASGEVPGDLLNQYALSEHDGHLRIATTAAGTRGPASGTAVRVLEERAGTLVEVGRVDGLGKGERVYAVRFLGPVGYLVTFRQTDPLYTLDLRDPRHPRAVGELKLTGYSAYLHPAGDGRLLGVGQEATERGRPLGTQVSLFDVRDPARPARVARHQVPGGYSVVESDPHAFLYWPDTGLVVVPVSAPASGSGPDSGTDPGSGALALTLRGNTLTVLGTVRQPAGQAGGYLSRSLVVGDTLWTLSDAGLEASDGRTLASRAWLPFR